MSSREEKLVKNTLVLSIGSILPKLATFIIFPILTGCLDKEELGIYDLYTTLVSLILPSATLQIQTAAFRYLIDRRESKYEVTKIVTNIYVFIVPVSIAALIVTYFCLTDATPLVRIMVCAYFMADILVNAARQVSRGLSNNKDYSVSAIISAAFKMIFTVVCVYWLKFGLFGVVTALFIASFCSFIYLFFKIRLYEYFDFSLTSWDTLKEMLQYSWPMVPNSMSMWIIKMSDRMVIRFMSPMHLAANAAYAAANKIPQLLQLAQSTFTLAWQENASIYNKDKDVQKYYSSMFKTMYNLIAGFMGAMLAIAPFLFEILVRNKEYYYAYAQVPILFMGMFFYIMSSYLGGIYVAYKATLNVGVTTMAAAVINLVVDILLIQSLDLYAASISTLVSYMFLFIYRMFNVRKLVKLKYDYVHIILVFGILVTECCLCLQQNILALVFNFLIGTLAFFILNMPLVRAVGRKMMKFLNKRKKRGKNGNSGELKIINSDSVRYRNEKDGENGKKLPVLYESGDNCCGCSACSAICPVGAISMEEDKEGFLYPVVDASKCVRCYKCLSVCDFKQAQKEKGWLVGVE